VITSAVLFGEIPTNKMFTLLVLFTFTGNSKKNEKEYRKKTQKRKHKRRKR
jgi:hypothetical protein